MKFHKTGNLSFAPVFLVLPDYIPYFAGKKLSWNYNVNTGTMKTSWIRWIPASGPLSRHGGQRVF